MIIAWLIWLATLVIDLFTDVRRYYQRRAVDHTRGAVLRLFGLVPACALGGWAFIPVALFGYWILFNGLYNVFTGRRWFYVGGTANLDKLERRYPWIVWVKYLAFLTSIIIYAKSYS